MGLEQGGRPALDREDRENQTRREDYRKRVRWHAYYFGFAAHAATMAKPATKVGAVLIGPDGEIRMTGFNGPPRGVVDTPNRLTGADRYLFASHAEQNLVAFCARQGIRTEGCTLYVTNLPCSGCAKTIIQAGIKTVYCYPNQTSMAKEEFDVARQMLQEASVNLIVYDQGELKM